MPRQRPLAILPVVEACPLPPPVPQPPAQHHPRQSALAAFWPLPRPPSCLCAPNPPPRNFLFRIGSPFSGYLRRISAARALSSLRQTPSACVAAVTLRRLCCCGRRKADPSYSLVVSVGGHPRPISAVSGQVRPVLLKRSSSPGSSPRDEYQPWELTGLGGNETRPTRLYIHNSSSQLLAMRENSLMRNDLPLPTITNRVHSLMLDSYDEGVKRESGHSRVSLPRRSYPTRESFLPLLDSY